MNRQEALDLLRHYVKNERMINHCLASEAVLRAMAEKLGQDVEKWGLAGLLHDLDVEITNADPLTHTHETVKILREKGVDEEIIEAIRLHNEYAHSDGRRELFHHALAAGETITGLVMATAMVYPDKKIASVKPKSVTKRMKEKSFAASVNRDTILECEKAGIPLDEFAALSIQAMSRISDQLGL
ncbi:MAG: HDIG domain-containing protein [Bacteroidetes bacterium]|nr:HDIG domain-containing protein [Bacteroidota bacterium]